MASAFDLRMKDPPNYFAHGRETSRVRIDPTSSTAWKPEHINKTSSRYCAAMRSAQALQCASRTP